MRQPGRAAVYGWLQRLQLEVFDGALVELRLDQLATIEAAGGNEAEDEPTMVERVPLVETLRSFYLGVDKVMDTSTLGFILNLLDVVAIVGAWTLGWWAAATAIRAQDLLDDVLVYGACTEL